MKTVFMKNQLRKIRREIQDLIGTISIEELMTNRRLRERYQELHYEFVRVLA